MGYGNPDIEEIPDARLVAEIDRRARIRMEGKCSYCGNAAGMKPGCMQASQHMTRTRGISESAIESVVNDVGYILGTKK